ncbi:MAG: HAD-IA family hydrolase [Chloroflexi bacterium]|nr:HAD-IA family hydrolase [Chloroflexota bacterium]
MKLQAVIFDLGGTLYREGSRAQRTATINRMAEALAVSPVEFGELWNAGYNEQLHGGLVTCADYVRGICRQLAAQVTSNQVALAADIFSDSIKQLLRVPRDDAVHVLTSLKTNGRKIGLVSNAASYLADNWELSPLARFFDVATFSCSVGLRKPDPQIYLLTIKKLSVQPEECLYVADGKYQELSGASELGMSVVQIRAPGETDNDVERQSWNGPRVSSLKGILSFLG